MESNIIRYFNGEYAFLSNFYPIEIFFEGAAYPSVEHAYQAAKTLDLHQRTLFCDVNLSPGQAKRRGRKITIRDDWEDIKLLTMGRLVWQKFDNDVLSEKLISTHPAELREGNWWGDKFWGICDGEGHNHLGKLLMKKRDQLRSAQWFE